MSTETKTLDPKAAWLFAGAAIVCGIAISFGLKTASWKVSNGVLFALFTGLSFASTYLTSANVMGTWGRFTAAAAVFGVFLMWFIIHNDGQVGLIPSVPGFDSIIKIVLKAGAKPLAIFLGIWMALVTSLCGLFGAWGGARLRAGKSPGLALGR